MLTPFASLCQVQSKIRLIRNYYSEVIGPEGWGVGIYCGSVKYQHSTARIIENENEISPKISQSCI